MNMTVCKFGGTSLADGNNIRRAAEIVLSDPSRKFAVVSAPGKRYSDDGKVTDLLYESCKESRGKDRCGEAFAKIRKRFLSIVAELGLNFDITPILDRTEADIAASGSADFAASRGEYLNARIVAV